MGIDTIRFKEKKYPQFQSQGFAAQFAFPFAKHICKGVGVDVGCSRVEWALPGAEPVDINLINNPYHAMALPTELDFIFSSHCLEHIPDWVGVVDYWQTRLAEGGILFLYLPHYSQTYWRPWNNRKHVNILTPEIIETYLRDRLWNNIFVSGHDLNNSFYAIAEKP